MAEMKLYELEMLRSRIYHGEQELISTLTPEQFFALLSHDYDTGFAAGKASAQKEILCMLACLLYTSPSPRDVEESRMQSSA